MQNWKLKFAFCNYKVWNFSLRWAWKEPFFMYFSWVSAQCICKILQLSIAFFLTFLAVWGRITCALPEWWRKWNCQMPKVSLFNLLTYNWTFHYSANASWTCENFSKCLIWFQQLLAKTDYGTCLSESVKWNDLQLIFC